jgi:hypothetical protein
MPITRAYFVTTGPDEIHLVRGSAGQSTAALTDWLRVVLPDGSTQSFVDYRGAHPDVSVLFSPSFLVDSETPTAFQGFGITVEKTSGKVSVSKAPAPAPAPSNFMLEAAVTEGTGPSATVQSAFIRVHAHDHVERIWFTPSRLSVRARPGTGGTDINYPFTVRAEFDDGTVADVTASPELTFAPSTAMAGQYVRIPASASPGDVLPVTVKTSTAWDSRSANGEIEVLDPWETEPNPPMAEWIDGNPQVLAGSAPTQPGPPDPAPVTLRPESVPNVLFLGCGFTTSELAAFGQITDRIVHELRTHLMLRPYQLLATSMNYWRLTIPAASPGVTIRYEVAPRLEDGLLLAKPLPAPVKPPANMAEWSVEHLLFAVGLPVSGDIALVKDRDNGQPLASLDSIGSRPGPAFDFDDLFKKWRLTVRPFPGQGFDQVPAPTARDWLVLADRTFIDDVNNYPPVSIGFPPSNELAQTDRFSQFTFRGTDTERSAFFRRVGAQPRGGAAPIALDNDEPLGNLWITDPATRASFLFDNRNHVAAYCNIPIGQIDSAIYMRLQGLTTTPAGDKRTLLGIPVTRVPGRRALIYSPLPLTAKSIDSVTWHTFAHELAHTFHLGDEYAMNRGIFTGQENELDGWANLTTPDTLLDATGAVVVDKIKWNWHRIRKASVLTRDIVDAHDGGFHVFVGPGRGLQFTARDPATQRPGDKVRLRRRRRHEVIGRPPGSVTSEVEFEVLEIHATNLDDPNDHRNMTLVLKADGPVDVSPFGEDSVVYIPVPAPDDIRTPQRPYLTLVPPGAERIMTKIGGPMNAKTCDPKDIGLAMGPIEKDPAGKVRDDILTHLVGVYFGGDRYECGVTHPVNGCLMRTSQSSPEGTPKGVSAFCPVCRYALVDFIDPEQHWANDRDYDLWFPF